MTLSKKSDLDETNGYDPILYQGQQRALKLVFKQAKPQNDGKID